MLKPSGVFLRNTDTAIAQRMKTIRGKGTCSNKPLPMNRKGLGKLVIGEPRVMTSEMPSYSFMVPSVARMGGILTLATSTPLSRPQRPATAIEASTLRTTMPSMVMPVGAVSAAGAAPSAMMPFSRLWKSTAPP